MLTATSPNCTISDFRALCVGALFIVQEGIIFEFWCESFGWYWNKLVTLREIHEWILRSIEPHFGEMDSDDNEGGRLWNPIGYVLWPTMQKYLSWCWMRTTSQESHLLVESQTKKEYSTKLEPYIYILSNWE